MDYLFYFNAYIILITCVFSFAANVLLVLYRDQYNPLPALGGGSSLMWFVVTNLICC
jgi:hypothetical protein